MPTGKKRKQSRKNRPTGSGAAGGPPHGPKDGSATETELRDALLEAQTLVYDAWEAEHRRDRVALAKSAIAVSDMCADALMLLANNVARGVVEKRRYCERALEAGRRAVELELGPDAFSRKNVAFWGELATRPYMRALAGFSDCLWDTGERTEAVTVLRDLLSLNPNDNQGNRTVLAARLFALGDLDGVEDLLETYMEPALADWAWNNALLLFLRRGPSAKADAALRDANETNNFVPGLLTRAERMPRTMPPHYALGSREEAVVYVDLSRENWAAAPRALLWVDEKTRGK